MWSADSWAARRSAGGHEAWMVATASRCIRITSSIGSRLAAKPGKGPILALAAISAERP